MTDKKKIEDALNLVKAKFDDPKLKPRFSSFTKNMQFTFTDFGKLKAKGKLTDLLKLQKLL